MRFKELVYGGKTYKNGGEITRILEDLKFYWLIDSEFESAKIEIKRGVLIWNSGNYYSGNWKFGIFKSGDFYGKWENGIFEGGNFKGIWVSGINNLI